MENYKDEEVLAVSKYHLGKWFDTYQDTNVAIAGAVQYHSSFIRRDIAEDIGLSKDRIQVIPYVVLQNSKGEYFVTKRIGGDSRLVGSFSIGLGGHINKTDKKISNLVKNCIDRELKEELNNCKIKDIEQICAFVDNSSEVSSLHVCILFVAQVADDDITIKEVDKLEGGWLSLEELANVRDKLESWSRIALSKIEPNLDIKLLAKKKKDTVSKNAKCEITDGNVKTKNKAKKKV